MTTVNGEELQLKDSYSKTRLYQSLRERCSSDARGDKLLRVVDEILEQAEQVLRAASTSPLDFTLHDNQHSFRVAENMIWVLPPDMRDQLSIEELALLLLSAYLHDIGMTPSRETIVKFRDLMVGFKDSPITDSEQREFYAWFDSSNFADSVTVPIQMSNAGAMRQLEQILTYFIRAKHNDWSAAWIEGLNVPVLTKYPDFKEDLIRLCKSHHHGFEELVKDSYSPKQVGISESPVVVHLRYLACILRLADILDFDPERTPAIIYRHRSINPSSRIYWYQTFHISSALSSDRKTFVFEAHPPDASLHQALREVVLDINRELQLCRRIDQISPFEHSVSGKLPHRWDLPSELTVSILPRNNSYEFIEGAFRPNTSKLLELLSGTHLYHSELDSVRELVQNSFDAIKEAIAYELLNDDMTSAGSELKSESLTVEIRVEEDEGRLFLICADQGVGMTKNIIENYVLVSGNSRSTQLRSLERRLAARGLQLGRTGKFGIGMLSYFMLADHMVITTRRGQLCSDEEATGWLFETEGIGSFGELRRQNHRLRGTEVRLRIKPSVASSLVQLEERVYEYLKRMLVRVPCKVRFVGPSKNVVWKVGWTRTTEDFESKILKATFREYSTDSDILLSQAARQKRLRSAEQWRIVNTEIKKCLRWHVIEGRLSNDTGYFRAHLPYFDLFGDVCSALLLLRKEGDKCVVETIGSGNYFDFEGTTVEAWKGMLYSESDYHRQRLHEKTFFVEIDWTSSSAGEISVSRWGIRGNAQSEAAEVELKRILRKELKEFLAKHGGSQFETLSTRLNYLPSNSKQPHWIHSKNGELIWAPLTFPSRTAEREDRQESIGKEHLNIVRVMRNHSSEYDWKGVAWPSYNSDPDRIMPFLQPYSLSLAAIYDGPSKISPLPYISSEFPPNWESVIGAHFSDLYGWQEDATVWNRNNPIAREFSAESWRRVYDLFAPLRNSSPAEFKPLLHRDQLLNDQGFLANFMGQIVSEHFQDTWAALLENDKELSDAVMAFFERCGLTECYFARGHWYVFSGKAFRKLPDQFGDSEAKRLIPKPSLEWMIITAQEAGHRRRFFRSIVDPWSTSEEHHEVPSQNKAPKPS